MDNGNNNFIGQNNMINNENNGNMMQNNSLSYENSGQNNIINNGYMKNNIPNNNVENNGFVNNPNQAINNIQHLNQNFNGQMSNDQSYFSQNPSLSNIQMGNNVGNIMQPVNNQPVANSDVNNYDKKPKNNANKKYLIVIIILIVVIIGLSVGLILVITSKEDNKVTNIYETCETQDNYTDEDDDDEIENTDVSNDIDNETINYGGFEFTKLDGYYYEIVENMLNIYSESFFSFLSVIKTNYDFIDLNELENTLSYSGASVLSIKEDSYKGYDLILAEVILEGNEWLYYVVETENRNYCFEGMAILSEGYDYYKLLDEITNVLGNVEETGDISSYSTEFGKNISIDAIKKK